MTFTRLTAVGTGAMAVGLLAAGVPPGRITPQAAEASQAVAKPSAGAGTGVRDARPPAVGEDDKPLVVFFEIRDRARSVVFLIDRSGSMASRDSLRVAKHELLKSLEPLPPDARFAVIFYNMEPRTLIDDQGHAGLMAATASNRGRVQARVAGIVPEGGTDHVTALRAALALKPEAIFFLTDADLMTIGDVDEILGEMGKGPSLDALVKALTFRFDQPADAGARETRIHIIEFGRGARTDQESPLRRLARTTGGSDRYLDYTRFPKADR